MSEAISYFAIAVAVFILPIDVGNSERVSQQQDGES